MVGGDDGIFPRESQMVTNPEIIDAGELSEAVGQSFEWLVIEPEGRTFPLRRDEIEITAANGRTLFGFVGARGFRNWRVTSFECDGAEIALGLSGGFGRDAAEYRMVPRTPAAELTRQIEAARLEKANEAARAIAAIFPGRKLERVSLNTANGRLARIIFADRAGARFAVLTDVTTQLSHEGLLASALTWLEELKKRRKHPIRAVTIAAGRKQVRNLRKLHALLRRPETIGIIELTTKSGEMSAAEKNAVRRSDLWRDRSAKLRIPSELLPSRAARRIIEMSPENIDVIFSRQGETLRFLGLPFARVRTLMGKERAWFGIGKERRPLSEENEGALTTLVADLERYRTAETTNTSHLLYRAAPEAWLGAILRRNIRALDANLVLSPIYNQFRTLNDKIDLLALRRDGRLVIIELKTSPDRELVFQAADYWRKIELQRRRGELSRARLFGDMEIADKPALIYTAAPALSFHRDHEFFVRSLSADLEIWRFELHEDWRTQIKVIGRRRFE